MELVTLVLRFTLERSSGPIWLSHLYLATLSLPRPHVSRPAGLLPNSVIAPARSPEVCLMERRVDYTQSQAGARKTKTFWTSALRGLPLVSYSML
jgi:hypothetical protein